MQHCGKTMRNASIIRSTSCSLTSCGGTKPPSTRQNRGNANWIFDS